MSNMLFLVNYTCILLLFYYLYFCELYFTKELTAFEESYIGIAFPKNCNDSSPNTTTTNNYNGSSLDIAMVSFN